MGSNMVIYIVGALLEALHETVHILTKACLLESFPPTSMVTLPSVRIVYEPCWYPRRKGLQLCHLAQSPASYLSSGISQAFANLSSQHTDSVSERLCHSERLHQNNTRGT